MTRRDYVALASALANAQPERVTIVPGSQFVAWLACCVNIAHKLSADNPRFDTVRFLTACGATEAIDS